MIYISVVSFILIAITLLILFFYLSPKVYLLNSKKLKRQLNILLILAVLWIGLGAYTFISLYIQGM